MSGETKTPVLRFPDALPWARKRFGDFGTLRRGLTYSPADCRARGVRVLRSSNIDEDVFALHEDDVFVCKQAANIPFAKNGDILITSANGSSHLVGKHAIVRGLDEQSAVHGGFMLLAESDTPDFLNAAMGAPWYKDFVASNMLGGNGALGNLSKPVFEKCFFFAPSSTSEQRRIGGFFRELDALIAEREKALGKLESLKKAMLEKMFPQGDAKVPEVRFKGFEGEWEEKKLGDVCTGFDYGLNVAATKFDGRNRYIRITDIDDDSHAYNVLGAVSPDCNLSESKESIVCKGDILLARTGASVGKSYLYNENDGVMYFAGFLIRAHVSGEYDDFFVFCNTLTERYRQFVELTSQRSGQPGINAAEYKTFSFLTPVELAEQQAIGSFFRSLDALLAARREEAEKLKQLKKAFLERMFA